MYRYHEWSDSTAVTQGTEHRAQGRIKVAPVPLSSSLHRCLPPPKQPAKTEPAGPMPKLPMPPAYLGPLQGTLNQHLFQPRWSGLPHPWPWPGPSSSWDTPPKRDANGKIGPSTGAPSTANGATYLGATNNGRCRVRLDDSTLLRIRCPGPRFAHA